MDKQYKTRGFGFKAFFEVDVAIMDALLNLLGLRAQEATNSLADSIVEDIKASFRAQTAAVSAPGEVPASHTYNLYNSIRRIDRPRNELGQFSDVVSAIAAGDADAYYAGYVEFGTVEVSARPFIVPALQRAKRRAWIHYKDVVTTKGIK